MERRVVNQLASAFEQGLLTSESSVRLSVGGGGGGEGEGATVKLVVTEKGSGSCGRVDVGPVQCPLGSTEPLF